MAYLEEKFISDLNMAIFHSVNYFNMKMIIVSNLLKKRIPLMVSILIFCSSACTRNKDDNQPPAVKKYPSFIIAGQNSGSGIFYHLFNPEVYFVLHQLPGTDSCFVDINGDGIADFILRLKGRIHTTGFWCEHSVSLLGNNEIAVKAGTFLTDTIPANDTISDKLSWSDNTCFLYQNSGYSKLPEQTYSSSGYWLNAENKYIGVKVHTSDTLFYGWIRIFLPNQFCSYIYEYAGTTGY